MADSTTTQAPAFDFSALSVSEAEMPKQTGAGRPSKYGENPFVEVLAASYEAFKSGGNAGRKVTVPGAQAGGVQYLVRQAADSLGIGSRIIIRNSKGETLTTKEAQDDYARKNVTVLFSGKDRKKSKKDETETAPETAEVTA